MFLRKPYQGADPEISRFVFIGLDANYQSTLEDSRSYHDVLAYHADGVGFWQQYNVHHPFLLPHYHGDGRRYHLNFARIGFRSEHAEQVSFVELLHVPTTGRSKLIFSDLDPGHLQYLDKIIRHGKAEHIFVSAGVLKLLQATTQFRWIKQEQHTPSVLPIIFRSGNKAIYLHLHFSNYGKFQKQMDQEALAIQRLFFSPPNT